MHSIKYLVVGEEDYAFGVKISSAGEYEVNSGTYTTEPPRKGTFEAHLTIGEGNEAVTCSFWEGALEEDPELNDLVQLLEKL